MCERIPQRYGLDPLRDIQVLHRPCTRENVGTQALNVALQERLNPPRRVCASLKRKFAIYREGDRVIQLKNNYDKEVFNGDLGWIVEADPDEHELMIEFDGNFVHFESSELDEVGAGLRRETCTSRRAASTAAVVMAVVTQHFLLLQRNLLYTGLTRARELAVAHRQRARLQHRPEQRHLGQAQHPSRPSSAGHLLREPSVLSPVRRTVRCAVADR